MRHRGTDNSGSFEAWGLGLNYIYEAQSHILDIVHARRNKPLIYIDFDESLAHDPLGFINFLEKSSQIRALMLSSNHTVDISETMNHERLCAILSSVASMARYCFDLEHDKFERFSKYFIEEHELKDVKVEHTKISANSVRYYKIELTTQKNNTAEGQGQTLYNALSHLSDDIIHNLLPTECGYNMQSRAHELLRISYALSAYACVLNTRFVPIHKITKRESEEQKDFAQKI